MQAERIEKIKKLVESSNLLSPTERQEWLSLLELMNDKQLLELEKILEPMVVASKPLVAQNLNSPKPSSGITFPKPVTSTLAPKQPLSVKPVAVLSPVPKAEPVKPTTNSLPTQTVAKPPVVPVALPKIEPKKPLVSSLPLKNPPATKPLNPLGPKPAIIFDAKNSEQKESFHHIMNLPRVNSAGENSSAVKKEPVAPVVKVLEDKSKNNGFFKKLKEILEEKELPAPVVPKAPPVVKVVNPEVKPETLQSQVPPKLNVGVNLNLSTPPQAPLKPKLEIPENKTLDPSISNNLKTSISAKPSVAKEVVVEKPTLSFGQKTVTSPPSTTQPKLESLPKKEVGVEDKKEFVKPSGPLPQGSVKPEAKVSISQLADKLQKQAVLHRQEPASSGIHLPQNSEEAKAKLIYSAKNPEKDVVESPKEKVETHSTLPPVQKENKHVVALRLQSVEEISQLDRKVLNLQPESVALGIKNLISKFGYHQVIFALEKSSVYKQYIATGLNILSKKVNEDWPHLPDCLSKKEFENFTDLLRQVQAG